MGKPNKKSTVRSYSIKILWAMLFKGGRDVSSVGCHNFSRSDKKCLIIFFKPLLNRNLVKSKVVLNFLNWSPVNTVTNKIGKHAFHMYHTLAAHLCRSHSSKFPIHNLTMPDHWRKKWMDVFWTFQEMRNVAVQLIAVWWDYHTS